MSCEAYEAGREREMEQGNEEKTILSPHYTPHNSGHYIPVILL